MRSKQNIISQLFETTRECMTEVRAGEKCAERCAALGHSADRQQHSAGHWTQYLVNTALSLHLTFRYVTGVNTLSLILPNIQSDCVDKVRPPSWADRGHVTAGSAGMYNDISSPLCSENCEESDYRRGEYHPQTIHWRLGYKACSMLRHMTYDMWWSCLQCAAQHSMSAHSH